MLLRKSWRELYLATAWDSELDLLDSKLVWTMRTLPTKALLLLEMSRFTMGLRMQTCSSLMWAHRLS
jgi:hypothetical protein